MFKEVEIIYTVICDECGLDCCDDTPYIGWKKKEDVLEAAKKRMLARNKRQTRMPYVLA